MYMSQIEAEVAGSCVEALFCTDSGLDICYPGFIDLLLADSILDFMILLCVNASTVLVFPGATDQELGWLNRVMTSLWAG